MISPTTTSVMRSVPDGRMVLLAERDADLTSDGFFPGRLNLGFAGAVALVVVNGPGEGGDGHDQGAQRDRVEETLRPLVAGPGGQGGLDLDRQVLAQVVSRAGRPSCLVSRVPRAQRVMVRGEAEASGRSD